MIDHLLIGLTRFLVGGHPEWVGSAPEDRQRIYFANHASHLDTVLLWAALPPRLRRVTHPVAAADYWGRTRLRRAVATGVLNAVQVDRTGGTDPRQRAAAVEGALAAGHSLVIFPEGTRGPGPEPAPFKSGLFHLSQQFPDAELIPVWLSNPARAFPRGAYLPVPISCRVRFGAALDRRAGEGKDDFLTRARNAVVELSR